MKKEGWAVYKEWLNNRNTKPVPQVGDIWHISISKALSLCTMQVSEITDKTVLLISTDGWIKHRYNIKDVEFVEKV